MANDNQAAATTAKTTLSITPQEIGIIFQLSKEQELASLDPKLLLEQTAQVNAAAKSGSGKLSHDEAISYLQDYLKNPPVPMESAKIVPTTKDLQISACENPTKDDMSQQLHQAFDEFGKNTVQSLGRLKAALDSLKGNNGEILDTRPTGYSPNAKFDNFMKTYPNMDAATKQLIQDNYRQLETVLFAQTKDVLANNPKLREQVGKLPELSELGTLNAGNVCGILVKNTQKSAKL